MQPSIVPQAFQHCHPLGWICCSSARGHRHRNACILLSSLLLCTLVGSHTIEDRSPRGMAGEFSGMSGCTPSTAGQCAVQHKLGGSTSFSRTHWQNTVNVRFICYKSCCYMLQVTLSQSEKSIHYLTRQNLVFGSPIIFF